jgi:flagellar hook-associated protein 2
MASISNIMRINGLSSGMDIDDMVSKLMKAQRIPLDKINQQKQLLEWKRDDYRTMNTKLLELKNAAFDMTLQAPYQAKKASSANESVVSVSASSSTTEGIYKLQVHKLASSASATSGALGVSDKTAKLEAIGFAPGGESILTVGGDKGTATIRVKASDTIEQLVAEVNGKSSITGVKLNYDETLDRLFFVSSKTGESANITLRMETTNGQNLINDVLKMPGGGITSHANASRISGTKSFVDGVGTLIDKDMTGEEEFKISVNDGGTTTDYTYKINNKSTIGKLIDQINTDLGKTGKSAYLDSATGKLAIFSPDGADTISFSDATAGGVDLLDKLGLTAPTTETGLNYTQYVQTGTNAEVSFNGVFSDDYESNTFTIGGMNFTAKQLGGPVDITVAQDVESVYNNIKKFVDKYNEIIDIVNKELNEKRYRDFKPLTEEQREDMDEDDIKRWEEKAKSGLLNSDNMLSSGLSKFRNALSEVVSGLPTNALKSLSEIGISSSIVIGATVSGNYLERGKLYIDDAKLKQAITDRPEELIALFNSNDGDKESDDGDGIATRIYQQADTLFRKIVEKAGTSDTQVEDKYTMGKEMKEMNKRIDAMTRRMESLETRYYKQFTAMEKFINQMNSQSSWLAQQFGG